MERQEWRAGKLLVWAMRCWAAAFLIECAITTIDGLWIQPEEPLYWAGFALVFVAGVVLSFGTSDMSALRAGPGRSAGFPNPAHLVSHSGSARSAERTTGCTPPTTRTPDPLCFAPMPNRFGALRQGSGEGPGWATRLTGTSVNYRCRLFMTASFTGQDAAAPTGCLAPTPHPGGA